MNNLQIFNFKDKEVRTVVIDGEPYFVGKDVADILGYQRATKAISDHVDTEDKDEVPIQDSIGRMQNTPVINESGVYALIFGSKLPEAKEFKHKVTHEILPQIRQTGVYGVPQKFSEALLLAAKKQAIVEEQALLLEQQQHKVEFFDQVTNSKDAIEMAAVAKALNIKGIGRNKLFDILRKKGILRHDNTPYQKYCDAGYFRVIEQKYNKHGEVKISLKPVVYQKGLDFIRTIVCKEQQ